jgi:hypothetical protein
VAAPAPTPPAERSDDPCACAPKRNGLADAVKQAVGGQDDDSPDLRRAVMDFARALMQALRADESGPREGDRRRRGDDGEVEHGVQRGHRHHGHGHARHHHDHGYRRMRGLGERIEALAQDLARPAAEPAPAAAAPQATTTAPAPTTPKPALAEVVPLPTPLPTRDAAAPATNAVDNASTTTLQGTVLIAQFHVEPSSTPFARWQDKLLDAFRELRDAAEAPRGERDREPDAVADDDATLRNQLASFLFRLAHGLDDARSNSLAAPTAPGALLDLAA